VQSYCTIEYADEYFQNRLHAESWGERAKQTKKKPSSKQQEQ